jgi:hypothetical protein
MVLQSSKRRFRRFQYGRSRDENLRTAGELRRIRLRWYEHRICLKGPYYDPQLAHMPSYFLPDPTLPDLTPPPSPKPQPKVNKDFDIFNPSNESEINEWGGGVMASEDPEIFEPLDNNSENSYSSENDEETLNDYILSQLESMERKGLSTSENDQKALNDFILSQLESMERKKVSSGIKEEIVSDDSSTDLFDNPIPSKSFYSTADLADSQVDTKEKGKPDSQVDTKEKGKPDSQVDTKEKGKPDSQVDTKEKGKPDSQVDTKEKGKPDSQVDTKEKGKPDSQVDTKEKGKPEKASTSLDTGDWEEWEPPFEEDQFDIYGNLILTEKHFKKIHAANETYNTPRPEPFQQQPSLFDNINWDLYDKLSPDEKHSFILKDMGFDPVEFGRQPAPFVPKELSFDEWAEQELKLSSRPDFVKPTPLSPVVVEPKSVHSDHYSAPTLFKFDKLVSIKNHQRFHSNYFEKKASFFSKFLEFFHFKSPNPQTPLNASILSDRMYAQALANALHTPTFTIISLDDFFYSFSVFDTPLNNSFKNFSNSQVSVDYLKVLKINHLFSDEEFQKFYPYQLRFQPLQIWYEGSLNTYFSSFFYPIKKFNTSHQSVYYQNSQPYSSLFNKLEIGHINFSSLFYKPFVKSKNNQTLKFSEIYKYRWDFKTSQFVPSKSFHDFDEKFDEKKFHAIPLQNFPNLESDELDKFFFSAYSRLPSKNLDSSFRIPQVFRKTNRIDSFDIYFKFSKFDVDFLPSFSYDLKNIKNFSPSPYNFNIRRFSVPFNSIRPQSHLRAIFQPSPRYRRFFIYKSRRFRASNRKFSRRRLSLFLPDESKSFDQRSTYYYFFDPTTSFNKEYSNFFSKSKSSFKSKNFFDTVYARRKMPFRNRHYRFIDRDELRDPIFRSRKKFHQSVEHKNFKTNTRRRRKWSRDYSKHEIPYAFERPNLWEGSNSYENLFFNPIFEYKAYGPLAQFFEVFIFDPIKAFFASAFKSENFLSLTFFSLIFYFFDYVSVMLYVYCPFLFSLLDFALFSPHFHIFNFFTLFISLIIVVIVSFSILTQTFSPTRFFFFRVASTVFNFYFEILISILILIFGFSPNTKTWGHYFLISVFIFLSFLVLTFFSILFFILQFSRFMYYPYPSMFLPGPLFYQVHGFYKSDYFFSKWPKRFQTFRLFSVFSNSSKKHFASFQRSFFFVKFKLSKNHKFWSSFYSVPANSLFFPTIFYGPNVFSSYSYYQDFWNNTDNKQYVNEMSENKNFDEDLYSLRSYFDESGRNERILPDERNSWLRYQDENLDVDDVNEDFLKSYEVDPKNEKEIESVPIDPEYTNQLSSPLKLGILPKSDKPAQFNFFLHPNDPHMFRYDNRFELLELDSWDLDISAENSIGFWYPFYFSSSSRRVLPPVFFNLHSRPIDPVLRTNLLVPFLISLKTYPTSDQLGLDVNLVKNVFFFFHKPPLFSKIDSNFLSFFISFFFFFIYFCLNFFQFLKQIILDFISSFFIVFKPSRRAYRQFRKHVNTCGKKKLSLFDFPFYIFIFFFSKFFSKRFFKKNRFYLLLFQYSRSIIYFIIFQNKNLLFFKYALLKKKFNPFCCRQFYSYSSSTSNY